MGTHRIFENLVDSQIPAIIGSGSGHIDTLYPALFRKKVFINYTRQRISTPDNDFLDLDWVNNGGEDLVILSHGFEGSSKAQYITGMIRMLGKCNVDFLAWNLRSCSGEINRTAKFYHSGATEDLECVIQHVHENFDYKRIFLIGFSLGANLSLKFLGEEKAKKFPNITKAIMFSTPFDLGDASRSMQTGISGLLYPNLFLSTIKKKVSEKRDLLEAAGIDIERILKTKSLTVIDEHLTAKLHGFDSAFDYYNTQSCLNFIDKISIPTLVINAKNDPFLGPRCYPHKILGKNPNITFKTPFSGGHVGFHHLFKTHELWSEKVAEKFLFC